MPAPLFLTIVRRDPTGTARHGDGGGRGAACREYENEIGEMHLVHGVSFTGATGPEVESPQLHGSYARPEALAAVSEVELRPYKTLEAFLSSVDRTVDYTLRGTTYDARRRG